MLPPVKLILLRFTLAAIVSSGALVTQCDPGAPSVPDCAHQPPPFATLKEWCPQDATKPKKPAPKSSPRRPSVSFVVTFDPPVRSYDTKYKPIIVTYSVSGMEQGPFPVTRSPYGQRFDIWDGNIWVRVIGVGYHSCQIFLHRGGEDVPITPLASANLGPIRCAYGPNTY
jgi:hypothetical protein